MPKAVRSPIASDFERALGSARAAYERNETAGALNQLERARGAARKRADEGQLSRVLEFVDGTISRDERTEIARENLLYAVRQNLRQATRARALSAGEPWLDPYPELASPREHTRTFVSGGVKVWIAVGVAAGIAFFVLWAVAIFMSDGR